MADTEVLSGSIAGIIVKDTHVFIAKRSPIGQMGGRWEFPGGKIENGETQEEALHREFLEEFNCDIVIHEPVCKTQFEHNGKKRNLFAWSVSFAEDSPVFTLTEHTETKWVPVEKIEELNKAGNFVDSDMLLYPQVKNFVHNSTGQKLTGETCR